jgi:hypothetical protein
MTNEKATATARPWRATGKTVPLLFTECTGNNCELNCAQIVNANNYEVCLIPDDVISEPDRKAVIDLIVRAVNAHDELINFIRELLDNGELTGTRPESYAVRARVLLAKTEAPMSNTHPDIERYERLGVPTEPDEHFVCSNCDLDDFPEVTTECGCRVCKQCAIVCDDCGSIW